MMKEGGRQSKHKRISPLRTALRGSRGHGYITRRMVQGRRNSVIHLNKPAFPKKKVCTSSSVNTSSQVKQVVAKASVKNPSVDIDNDNRSFKKVSAPSSNQERRIGNRQRKPPYKLQSEALNSSTIATAQTEASTKKNESTNVSEELGEGKRATTVGVVPKSKRLGKENGLVVVPSTRPLVVLLDSTRIKRTLRRRNKDKSESCSPPPPRLTRKKSKTLSQSLKSLTTNHIAPSRGTLNEGVDLADDDGPPVLSRVDETDVDSGSESIKSDQIVISEGEENYSLFSRRVLHNLEPGSFWCYCMKSEDVFAMKDSVEDFQIHESGHPYCQARDLVDGETNLCARPCSSDLRLYRVSSREPFILLCSHHIDRLRLHQCCPLCGDFCTQGTGVMMCCFEQVNLNHGTGTRDDNTEKNSKNRKAIRHLFHMQCVLEERNLYYEDVNQGVNIIAKMKCPHCGKKDEIRELPMLLRISGSPNVPISCQSNYNDPPVAPDKKEETDHQDVFTAQLTNKSYYGDKLRKARSTLVQIPLPETLRQPLRDSDLSKSISRMTTNLENVICQDISRGKEPFKPIRCIDDFSSLQGFPNVSWNVDFTYVTNPVISDASVRPDTSFKVTHHCSCNANSSKNSCYGNKGSNCKCQLNSSVSYKEDGRLEHTKDGYSSYMTTFECNQFCSCHVGMCRNRVVQKGIKTELEVYYSLKMTETAEFASWGVRTRNKIPVGTFVCELVGEFISSREVAKRSDKSFIFDLSPDTKIPKVLPKTEKDMGDNSAKNSTRIFIDSKKFGNIGRFVNHSSNPNLLVVKVFFEHSDVLFPRVAFFASRNISAEEEITFDSKWYGG